MTAPQTFVNLGHMRLSTVAHLRALHRRRTISEAVADGIWHFRLDVPKSLLPRLGEYSIISPHLWRVRTLDAWQAIADARNSKTGSVSSFDTLGLHHGDVSYLIPVPALYHEAAVAEGEKWRRRWLESLQRPKAQRPRIIAA